MKDKIIYVIDLFVGFFSVFSILFSFLSAVIDSDDFLGVLCSFFVIFYLYPKYILRFYKFIKSILLKIKIKIEDEQDEP